MGRPETCLQPSESDAPPPYSPMDGELAAQAADIQGKWTTISTNISLMRPAGGRIDVGLDSRIARTLAQIIELQREDIHNPPSGYQQELQRAGSRLS